MANLMRGLLRVAVIGGIILAEVAATSRKDPFEVSSYARAQHLVNVGERHLNIYCSGSGSPTVILDAGLGEDTSSWRYVQRPIARHTRVCSYDRAGMGFSDPTTSARDARAVVSDLHALLRGAGIAPPYVLVGHSIAGLYTRLFADRYPHEVVGLVLVDPSTEYDDVPVKRMMSASAYSRGLREQRDTFRKCATNVSKCPFGNLAILKKQLKAAGCPRVDPADCAVNDEVYTEELARTSFWKDQLLELLAIPTSSAQVRAEQRSYGNLPLIVLTAGHPDTDPGPMTPTQLRAVWVADIHLHDNVAALSSRGVNFVIDGAGHFIQADRPSTVTSAVDEVVDQARYIRRSMNIGNRRL